MPLGELIHRAEKPDNPYLVFTSAGDHNNIAKWLPGKRYDLWVSYYGEQDEPDAAAHADYFLKQKGAKFQNLQKAYKEYPEIINAYEAVFVLDDDIILSGEDINNLFQIRKAEDLWLLQPAFRSSGKISHPITCWRPLNHFRYTNFIEVACPLFERGKLTEFLNVYDDCLVGWGIDYWFMQVIGNCDAKRKIAIIDDITCVNPCDSQKTGVREIDLLQSKTERKRIWAETRAKYNIPEVKPKVWGGTRKAFSFSLWLSGVRERARMFFRIAGCKIGELFQSVFRG